VTATPEVTPGIDAVASANPNRHFSLRLYRPADYDGSPQRSDPAHPVSSQKGADARPTAEAFALSRLEDLVTRVLDLATSERAVIKDMRRVHCRFK
jgi:hypothetical protein